jgi:hypothetical protein
MGSWILLVGFVPAIAYGAERPDWAFPVTDKIQPPSLANESKPKPPPGSTKSYTRKQIDDLSNPPDWYPNTAQQRDRQQPHAGAPPEAASTFLINNYRAFYRFSRSSWARSIDAFCQA